MRREGSSQVRGAALVLVGLAVGAGLVFLTTNGSGGVSTRTVFVTSTGAEMTITSTVTAPGGLGVSTTTTSTVVSQAGASTVTSLITTTSQVTVTRTVTVTSGSSTTSSAQFSAQVVSCLAQDPVNSNHATCEVTLTNSGSLNTTVNGCTLNIKGVGVPGTLAASDGGAATTILIGANGAQVTVWCLGSSAGGAPGSQALGTFAFGNGGSVSFTGTWQ